MNLSTELSDINYKSKDGDIKKEEVGAFLKLHYMREHPALSFGPLKRQLLLGKIQKQGQFAGNYFSSTSKIETNLGSSETIREAFILKDNFFKFWFIGFVEGGGSFIINKDGSLEFRFTQSSEDAQILFYIKKALNFGIVRIKNKNRNTHCFRVKDKEGLLKIISVFNGNIFFDYKKKQFELWLNAFNSKYKENILYLDNFTKPNLNNSWLCGFTDAEGCFTISIINSNKPGISGLVKISYILTQKGDFHQMNYIADMLNGKLHYLKDYDGYNLTVNTTKLSLIVNYFSTYPLKTKKNVVYYNWLKAYKLVKYKKHLTDEGFNLIKRYKKNLNKLDK